MKYIITIFLLFLTAISCDNKTNSNEAELVKIGYYQSFTQHFEIIVNLKDKYLLFYNPNSFELPPPPPLEDGASEKEVKEHTLKHENFVRENPRYEEEYIQLSEEEIDRIQNLINSFSESDFNENKSKIPIVDGASTSLVILFSNKKLYSIGGYEGTLNDKNIELTSTVYKILNDKSKSKINQSNFNKKME